MAYTGPFVGTAVFLRRPSDGRFLLGYRTGKGAPGTGTWGLVGGHLEAGESFEQCIARETEEEVGLRLLDGLPASEFSAYATAKERIRLLTATNDLFEDGRHYVTLFFVAEVGDDAEPVNMEPDKCSEWRWVDMYEMRRLPVMHGIGTLIASGVDDKHLARALAA